MPRRRSHAHRIFLALAGVLLLAVVGSGISWWAVLDTEQDMDHIVTTNMQNLQEVQTLRLALVEQQRLFSAYIHDGDREWLEDLHRREEHFRRQLERVFAQDGIPDKTETVSQLAATFREYDQKRDAVIETYAREGREAAHRRRMAEVVPLFDRLDALCENLASASRGNAEETVDRARDRLHTATLWMAGSVGLMLALGAVIAGLLLKGTYLPLRRMVNEARAFSTEPQDLDEADDVVAVGRSMQSLMADIRRTSESLERAREQLVNMEKMASLGRLAAGVAHEVRNPLASIRLRLYTLRRDLGEHPQYEDDLRVISEEIERLNEFIHDFLLYSRPAQPKFEAVSVPLVVERATGLLQRQIRGQGIRIEQNCPPDLPAVHADAQQLKQVLINLLQNAAEAMPGPGRVKVEARAETDAGSARPGVTIRVRDTGTGVPQEAQARLFEPFFSLREQGTGLGLSIAARILAEHEGRLVLESSSPGGSVFALWIPAAGEGGP